MPAQFSRTTRSLANDSAYAALVAWALALVFGAAWLAWFGWGRVSVVEVSAKARLEVRQAAHPVAAWLPGRIASSALVLGAAVQAGDVLVEFDAGQEVLRLREEQARLQGLAPQVAALKREIGAQEQANARERQAAQAMLQAARQRIDEAAAGLAFARDQERRLRDEASNGGVAEIDALRARAEAQKQAAAKDALASELRRLQADGDSREQQRRASAESLNRSLALLQGDLSTGRSTVDRLNADVERLRIRAPVAGHIGDVVPLRRGEVVAAGQKLATVIPAGDFIVVADFPPAAVLGRIHPGQAARLRLDGFAWAQYGSLDATVQRVAEEIREGLVRVEFSPQAPLPAGITLQHGLPGAIEVRIDQVSPAVLVLRASGQWLSAAAGREPISK